ncbi:MAG TPA: YbhN family protein, partial [Rubrivivax sp.]|nr:YbhN family protein [Rubrivivax sp.]
MRADVVLPGTPTDALKQPPRRTWWPAVRKWGGIAFIVLVLLLVARLASDMDWARAWQSLKAMPGWTLLAAAAFAACSHAVYSTYDLIGRHQTGHGVRPRRVLSVAFVSYAFNLNLGALVGGVAFRYRLYSRLGLASDVITRVLVLSMLTNWLGYLVLGGCVLLFAPPVLPEGWSLSQQALPL